MDVRGTQVTLHMRTREGSGTKVLMVHGWATSSAVWQPVLERWEGDEALYALDLRGTGFSDKPATGYTLEAFATDVADVLAALDEAVVLVGHSMGGLIAQRVAIDHPDKVKRLVLVSPVPAGGVPFADEDLAFFRGLAGRAEGMATVLGSTMAEPCANFDALHQASATVLPAAYLESLDTFRLANFADELPKLRAPTRVIGGDKEQILSPAVLEAAVVGLIDGADLQLVEGSGHYPQWERPEAFTRMLEAAVRS
ncbi:MAG: alpha/beta fold hydrolase [Deltaproteobacteria bacterium]|nr:MAG: alpha/beta fold hydrolase [Deltaproteobacteria bacterium]